MKFLKHTVWSLIVASMMGACMGFDEINVDPDKTNRPTPGMLATQVLFSMMDSRSNSSEGFANHNMLSKHLACGEKIRDYAYNRIGRTGFGAYTSLIEAEKMVECAAEVEKPAYRALAHFVRAYNLFYLTMRVGDIPYSEALGGEKGNFTPRYDTQKDVIAGVLDELDEAYELFSQASDFAGDFVFGGKPDKWMRTVNAFELKVLMYCAAKDAEIDAAARFAQVFGRGKLLASNADNFQLVYSSRPDQMYPFNQYPKFSMYMLVSSTLVEMLKEHEDRRLFYYAEPAQTLLSAGEDAYEAYEGVDPVAESSEIVNAYMRGSCSKLNNRYLETEAGEPFIRIGYAAVHSCRGCPAQMDYGRRRRGLLQVGHPRRDGIHGSQHAGQVPARREDRRRLYCLLSGGTAGEVRRFGGRKPEPDLQTEVHALFPPARVGRILRMPSDGGPRIAGQPFDQHEHRPVEDARALDVSPNRIRPQQRQRHGGDRTPV